MFRMMGQDGEMKAGDAYGREELAEAMRQFGLTPTLFPEMPVKINVEGGELYIREAGPTGDDYDPVESVTHYIVRFTPAAKTSEVYYDKKFGGIEGEVHTAVVVGSNCVRCFRWIPRGTFTRDSNTDLSNLYVGMSVADLLGRGFHRRMEEA